MIFVTPFGREHGGGGAVYTESVLALLRRSFGEDALEVVAPPNREDAWPRLARVLSVAVSAFGKEPAKAVFSRRSGLGRAAASWTGRVDGRTLIINGSDSYWFADAHGAGARKRVLICHNVESELYREQVDSMGILGRLVLRHLLRDEEKLRAMEFRAFNDSDLIVCISSDDAAYISTHVPGARTHHLPPLFEGPPAGEDRPPPAQGGPLRLGFLAKFSWWPNVDAVEWLTREIVPELPGDRELHLFGRGSEHYGAPASRVFGHGFVPDLAEVWRACDIVLCPMRAGGGVNVKFAEAVYHRMPVCATALAARGTGIDAVDCPGIRFLEGRRAWIEFLGSDAARSFARTQPGVDLAARFALEKQVEPLKAAFAQMMAEGD